MRVFLNDLRYALRDLRKSPAYLAIAVLTLAIGIGANSAMFSVVRGVLLDPLPYPESGKLVRILYQGRVYSNFPMNPADFLDIRAQNRVFESMAVYVQKDVELSDEQRPERLTGLSVAKDYFHVLGAALQLGQDFELSQEVRANGKVMILSDALWRRRFNADPKVIGSKVVIDREPHTIIGVAAADFQHPGGPYRSPRYGQTVDAWFPIPFQRGGRGSHFLNGVARLRPGVTMADAERDINRVFADIARDFPAARGWRLTLVSLRDDIVGGSQRMLLVLLGSVGFVLLIACVNVAGLMLVRATSRSRDLAVRAALGASRTRLVSQALAESTVISLLGAAAGAMIAALSVGFLARLAAAELPRTQAIRMDAQLLGFTMVLAIVTGLAFGLVPALAAARGDVNEALRAGGRSATQTARHARMRHVLVVGEIALASALLIGAGLFLRSFVNLLRVTPGFVTENVVTGILSTPDARYKDVDRTRFFRELNQRISALPGVIAAGASSDVPWSGYDENAGFTVEGRIDPPSDGPHARYHSATPDYFRAMGIPLLRGRFFTDRDDMTGPLVVVINQSMAERYWPGMDPVGRRITFADQPKEKDWFYVIGVVGDVKDAPSSKAAQPALWWSYGQQQMRDMLLVVRTARDPLGAVNAIRTEIAAIDRELPLAQVRTMEEVAGASRGGARLVLLLTGIFAGVALLLAAIGTYGVISYSVAQRTQEFGLRIALGARGFDLLRLIGGQGLRLAAVGVAIGLALALALGRLLSNLLYGVSAYDPLTLLASFGVAVVMVLAACLIPARRAAAVDPMVSLRCD